jgi:hypothetical protein
MHWLHQQAAEELHITGENYVWVVTQSVIENGQTHPQFPVGMLGVHFDTSSASLVNFKRTSFSSVVRSVNPYAVAWERLSEKSFLMDFWQGLENVTFLSFRFLNDIVSFRSVS